MTERRTTDYIPLANGWKLVQRVGGDGTTHYYVYDLVDERGVVVYEGMCNSGEALWTTLKKLVDDRDDYRMLYQETNVQPLFVPYSNI